MPAKKKRYPEFKPSIAEAAALQQRIAAGEATDAEAKQYGKMINVFRRQFQNGQLSERAARQFGIE